MITQQLQSTVMATAQAWVSPLTVQGVASLLSPGTGVKPLHSMPNPIVACMQISSPHSSYRPHFWQQNRRDFPPSQYRLWVQH